MSELLIHKDLDSVPLYIKKIRNPATIPQRSTETAAGYDSKKKVGIGWNPETPKSKT